MAKGTNHFDVFDTPYETQPPKGSAEGGIDYGAIADVDAELVRKDPMGVLPVEAKPRNIGPSSKE
jgi:hypothetical protein